MLSGIIGTIKAAVLGLDDRINAVGIGTGNCDTDLTQDSIGEAPAFEAFPGNAIIFGSVEPASWPAARKKPRLPSSLPQRSENNVWIVRIKNDIDPPGIFIFG